MMTSSYFAQFTKCACDYNPFLDQGKVFFSKRKFREIEKDVRKDKNLLPSHDITNNFFGDNEFLGISRKMIFDSCKKIRMKKSIEDADLEQFILSVLYWGFPSNLHGLCRNVYKSFYEILDFTHKIFVSPSNAEDEFVNLFDRKKCDEYNRDGFIYMQGVSVAFFSKLLFFARADFNGNPCLILDSFVIDGLKFLSLQVKKEKGDKNLIDWLSEISNYISINPIIYPTFLEDMNVLGSLAKCDSCKVEYVLWLIGKYCVPRKYKG